MIIARIIKLEFKLQKDKHTVDYAERCQKLEMEGWKDVSGTFKCVVADDVADAATKLRKIIRRWLKKVYFHPKPQDFCFEIGFDEVEEQDEFWGSLCTTDCHKYDV